MRRSLAALRLVACVAAAAAACGRRSAPPPVTAPLSGTVIVSGLTAPVRVVRDAWGVPHIYAERADDLFVAQGFVQAEDRLFQMDLWKRAAQGRLSQVLGANFVERDAMTRRVQYRGEPAAEWASYGPDAKAIAGAFTRGINAWVAIARARPPEEFLAAGWKPEFWQASDVLSRTDAFVESAGALESIARQHLSDIVADQIRHVGAAPFFAGIAPVSAASPHNGPADAPSAALTMAGGRGRAAATRDALSFAESARSLEVPSPRYVVHLHAPGWSVIGVTRPWLPGVVAGHNERIAWGAEPAMVETAEVTAVPAPSDGDVLHEPIVIKGRAAPFVFDTTVTPRGLVIAADRAHHVAYALRWSGFEPGAAAELAALAVDRARDWDGFRAALGRWKMPVRRLVYADVDGNVGVQEAGLVPVRRGANWIGWRTLDDLPHAFNPASGTVPSSAAVAPARPDASAVFAHVLGITRAARERFDIGPVARPADDAVVRAELVPRNWDRSRAMSAPGQSESPSSAHFRDLVDAWSAGGSIPLAFTDDAVQRAAASTLVLVPAGQGDPVAGRGGGGQKRSPYFTR